MTPPPHGRQGPGPDADEDADGCNTRHEVLLAEAVEPPTVRGRCTITGGVWHSYYDDTDVPSARSLDIDHLVPLAEAWDSGWLCS